MSTDLETCLAGKGFIYQSRKYRNVFGDEVYYSNDEYVVMYEKHVNDGVWYLYKAVDLVGFDDYPDWLFDGDEKEMYRYLKKNKIL